MKATTHLAMVTLLLASALIVLAPAGSATTPDFGTPTGLAGLTGGVTAASIRLDAGGEKVGVVYATTSGGNGFHFLYKASATAAWTKPNDDITGADAPSTSQYELAYITGSTWVVAATVSTLHKFYYSTDDGTTWTAGATDNCGGGGCAAYALYGMVGHHPTASGYTSTDVAILDSPSTSNNDLLSFKVFDYTTGTNSPATSSLISDSVGFGATNGIIITVSAADLVSTDTEYTAWFHSSGSGKNFHVSSEDGLYWSIPYTTSGGSTEAPDTVTNCPGTSATTPRVYAADGGTSQLAITLGKNGASNFYSCTWDGSGFSEAQPNAAPTTAQQQNGGAQAIASNGGGNYIAASREGTSNFVLYKASKAAAWATVYTTASNSAVYGVAATPTQAYYVFTDDALHGGRLTVAQAEMLPDSGQSQSTWCSNPNSLDYGGDPEADFGYNFAEAVDFGDYSSLADEGPSRVSDLEDSYRFTSTDDDYAYAGKGWASPGATTVRTYFRIEAATEGRDSEFRVGYSFTTDIPSAATKGNGGEPGEIATGAFANFIQARFDEEGNDWNMRIQFMNGGEPTTIGPAPNSFDPNTPHTFYFEVNTTGSGYAKVVDAESGGVILNQPMAGSGVAGYAAYAGADPMYSQWFVTMGSNTVLDSVTYLDDNIDNGQLGPNAQDSTCIDFYPSVTVYGDLGSVAGSAVVDLDDIDGDGVANDIDPDADGDGLCNGSEDLSVGTPGALAGCTAGDLDDDNDGILDVDDDTPSGAGSGTDGTGGDCTSLFCVDSASIPAGFTVAAFNGFLGLILVGMISVGGVGAMQAQSPGFKVGGGVVVLFAGIGYLMGLYFGLLPLWPVVIVVVVAAAYVFIRFRSGG